MGYTPDILLLQCGWYYPAHSDFSVFFQPILLSYMYTITNKNPLCWTQYIREIRLVRLLPTGTEPSKYKLQNTKTSPKIITETGKVFGIEGIEVFPIMVKLCLLYKEGLSNLWKILWFKDFLFLFHRGLTRFTKWNEKERKENDYWWFNSKNISKNELFCLMCDFAPQG